MLRAAGVAFVPHAYAYVERGGTKHSAESLGVPEHSVVKTLVMEARDGGAAAKPLLILMHGDREVSTKQLARQIGAREVAPASPAAVEKHTGYLPGGVSPFGTRKALPVHVERSILALERLLINGGRRGFLVEIAPEVLTRLLSPVAVDVAIAP
ncbi:MAG TPA: YbaK/EbsC family protein [Thermoanaerobaculia bacterium]